MNTRVYTTTMSIHKLRVYFFCEKLKVKNLCFVDFSDFQCRNHCTFILFYPTAYVHKYHCTRVYIYCLLLCSGLDFYFFFLFFKI